MSPFRPAPDTDLSDEAEQTLVSSGRRSDAELLIERLRELGWSAGVAESLTGGLVVASLIAVPGASAVVRGGIVAYATELKASLLGVDQVLLDAHGPVHERVARQMARGVRRTLGTPERPTDIGIATTGVAGPDPAGGQPVGTVYIAVSTSLGSRVESLHLEGDREQIRTAAAARAISFALEAL